MKAFNEVTTTDHCGLFLDISRTELLINIITPIPSSFDKQLQSNLPIIVRKYKNI